MAIGTEVMRDGGSPVDQLLPPGPKVTQFDHEAPALTAGSFFVGGVNL